MPKFIDLTGQKFNRLTVLERVNNPSGNRYKWKCRCDCGNIILVKPENLKNGHTKSCGCLQIEKTKEPVKKAIKTYKEKYIIENTNIAKIAQDKPNRNNKSGYTGVNFKASHNSWEARIQFQGKRYSLGLYKNVEDATKARKEAEEQYYKAFLEWYEQKYLKDKEK